MNAALEAFRRFAADYSRAQRAYENAMATQPGRADDAIARKQEIERDFLDCFALRKDGAAASTRTGTHTGGGL